jgi:multidrug efflux pump subunit AcrB
MTLGGLALAVGILVDDATVEIENIHRNLGERKPLVRAILDGAQQIATPAFVSTLCICIVFVPVVMLDGAAKYLFTPLAEAVVISMMASYVLSRTLIPTLVHYLLADEVHMYATRHGEHAAASGGLIWAAHDVFNRGFEKLRAVYFRALGLALAQRPLVVGFFTVFCIGSVFLGTRLGRDFFPTVDGGQIRLHVRAPAGTRIEETERIFAQVEKEIRSKIPAGELEAILDNIGVPHGFNLAFGDSATISSGDGEILISLRPEQHHPVEDLVRELRAHLVARFPELTIFFEPASITNQILNFGLPSPIDVQVTGRNLAANREIAQELVRRIAAIPGAVDVHLHQQLEYPEFKIDVDRTRAGQLGLTQKDVANSLLISLSSSSQVAPNFWLNPANGVNYSLAVQTPPRLVDGLEALRRTPVTAFGGNNPQLLENLAQIRRGGAPANISHYNVQPVLDVFANVADRDLGSVSSEVDAIVREFTPKLARGSTLQVRGQVTTSWSISSSWLIFNRGWTR